jgi:hypothetical protein
MIQLIQPIIATIIGGFIVIFTQQWSERRKDKRNLNIRFQEEYVVNGIDRIIERLRGLVFSYQFLLNHIGNEEVKPKEKISKVLKEPISPQFVNALGQLQMILPKDIQYDLAICQI